MNIELLKLDQITRCFAKRPDIDLLFNVYSFSTAGIRFEGPNVLNDVIKLKD